MFPSRGDQSPDGDVQLAVSWHRNNLAELLPGLALIAARRLMFGATREVKMQLAG